MTYVEFNETGQYPVVSTYFEKFIAVWKLDAG